MRELREGQGEVERDLEEGLGGIDPSLLLFPCPWFCDSVFAIAIKSNFKLAVTLKVRVNGVKSQVFILTL